MRSRPPFAAGWRGLADPEYQDGMRSVVPGIGPVHGVRRPLLAAVSRGFRHATRGERATQLLFIADRLFREPHLEARWFAFGLLERTLAADPERTWQLLRRAAREAGDWATVDDLAHPYGIGIAAEPYRWAELEQLVYSPSRWERRLIASTIATMTHGNRRTGRDPDLVPTALGLLDQLMGDAEPDVQKALAWAYRSLAQRDPEATTAALRARPISPPKRRTATARGSFATASPSSPPATPTSCAPGSPGSAGAAVLHRPRRRPRRPPASERCPDPINHPEPPLT